MHDLMLASGAMRVLEKGLRQSATVPREPYACGVSLFCSQSGNGLTLGLNQFAILQEAPFLVPRPMAPDRIFLDDVHEAVCGYRPSHWGMDATWRDICADLGKRDNSTLIVDEADRLLGRNYHYLGMLRAICDTTRTRLILGSRGSLRQALTAGTNDELRCVKSRLQIEVELPSPSVADARLIARELCEIEIAGDLAVDVYKRAGASIRSLINEFRAVEQAAQSASLTSLDLVGWRRLMGMPEPAKIAAPRATKMITPAAAADPREARSAGGAVA